jgi:PAS domain S-box-containing protein
MARPSSSDHDSLNRARIWALRAGDPLRVAPAAADLHRNGGTNGAAAARALEERGRAEAALAFAASIVESSDDAIIGKTLDGMVTSWNAGAERLYGYAAREVIGRWPIGITIPEDEQSKTLKRVGRGERVDHYETVGIRKDGRRIDVSVTVSPIQDASGRIVGASLIARDITRRKEAEAAIRERDILRCVASLAAAAAHEINNPLAVIVGHVDLLERKYEEDPDTSQRIERVRQACRRIAQMIVHMGRITRLEEPEDQSPNLPPILDLRRSSEADPS